MARTRRHIREKRKRLRRLGAFLVALVTLLLCVLLAPEIIRRPRLLEHANEGEPAIALAAEPGDDLASLDSIERRAHDTVVDHVADLSDGTSPGDELENGGAPLT